MSAWTQRRASQPPPACVSLPALPSGSELKHAVETEVIPRLLHLHSAAAPAPQPPPIDAAAVARFTQNLLQGEEPALEQMRQHLESGVPVPQLCLELMAPAARQLGEMWSADGCDFVQVTLATGVLQRMLRAMPSGWTVDGGASALTGRPALFSAVPGEQHTLGLAMVADFFRVVGCQVRQEIAPDGAALLQAVRSQPFDLVGFSIGAERHVPALTRLIAEVRRQSLKPDVKVLAGGPLVSTEPELARSLGADAMAVDALQAILAANTLLTG